MIDFTKSLSDTSEIFRICAPIEILSLLRICLAMLPAKVKGAAKDLKMTSSVVVIAMVFYISCKISCSRRGDRL